MSKQKIFYLYYLLINFSLLFIYKFLDNQFIWSIVLTMLFFTTLFFIKTCILKKISSKFHYLVNNSYFALLFCYFMYCGNFLGLVGVTSAYCLSTLSGTLEHKSESSQNSSVYSKGGTKSQTGSEGSMQQSGIVEKGSNVESIHNTNNSNNVYADASNTVLAMGAISAIISIGVSSPSIPVRVASITATAVVALGASNGEGALREMGNVLPAVNDIVGRSLERQLIGSGFPGESVANSSIESSTLDKLKNFFDPTLTNNPFYDFSHSCAMLLGVVLIINLYIAFNLLLREPIVEKLTQKLKNYGKIGFIAIKYLEFLTAANRVTLILMLCCCSCILYLLINWMFVLGTLGGNIDKYC